MFRYVMTAAVSCLIVGCGVQNTALQDVGSSLDPTKRTLEVQLGFKNTDLLDHQLHLLSKAGGLAETRSAALYGALDLEGEYVEFLATPGLKYGDIVTEGSILKLATSNYPGDALVYKIGDSLPKDCDGSGFEQGTKADSLIAVSGHLKDTPAGDAKQLIYLCKNMSVKQPYTEEWRKIDCDLNIVGGKLQLSYHKTAVNPNGTIYTFDPPVPL